VETGGWGLTPAKGPAAKRTPTPPLLLHYCTTALLHYCTTALLHYCTAARLPGCPWNLLPCCPAALPCPADLQPCGPALRGAMTCGHGVRESGRWIPLPGGPADLRTCGPAAWRTCGPADLRTCGPADTTKGVI